MRGLRSVPSEWVERHRRFLVSRQNSDGGWSGREGGSDLYYSAFALRGLAITGGLIDPARERAAHFLKSQLDRAVSVVDFMSLLYAARLVEAFAGPRIFDDRSGTSGDWQERVALALETFRKPDGGYAKSVEAHGASTYHTFLVALCYELIDRAIPGRSVVVEFVRSRAREDGGYVEVSAARRGGTNPTAAAVALLIMLESLASDERERVVRFLVPMQSAEGGLRANDRAPLADLLSTFTGLLTLSDLGAMGRVDLDAVRGFVGSVDAEPGGFRGGLWDDATDVEYTFYGVAATALLQP